MHWIRVLTLPLLAFFSSASNAEIVTESWLQQAGVSCGGGLNVEVQGEIDAAVMRRFKLASINADGRYKQSDAETLLKQFKSEEKRPVYSDYIQCLVTLMQLASDTSGLPPNEIILDSPIAIAPLETIKRGNRFVLVPGDTVAIKNYSVMFTLKQVYKNLEASKIKFVWSNSDSGTQKNTTVEQAKLIKIGENCTLIPYKIDIEGQQASFLSNC